MPSTVSTQEARPLGHRPLRMEEQVEAHWACRVSAHSRTGLLQRLLTREELPPFLEMHGR